MHTLPVFSYKALLWTLTDTHTLEKQIDSFQRRMLRRLINICWPKVISNERLYEKTEIEEWSVIIRKRRLDWLGHLMRLDKKTPVRLALYESLQPVQRKRGRPCSAWMNIIEKDLSLVVIKLNLNKKNTR